MRHEDRVDLAVAIEWDGDLEVAHHPLPVGRAAKPSDRE
jgi:hypothetical protein